MAIDGDDFLAYDLSTLLTSLGELAMTSSWLCRGIEAYGTNADELHVYSDKQQRIEGQKLLEIVSNIDNIADGYFHAYLPTETEPWLVVRAIDNSVFEIKSHHPRVAQLKKERNRNPARATSPSKPMPQTDDHYVEKSFSPDFQKETSSSQSFQAKLQRHIPLVESVLTDFALQNWGGQDVWEWHCKPVYRATSLDFFNGRVIGAVSNRRAISIQPHPSHINSETRLCISLEGDTPSDYHLRVFAFQDYGYFQLSKGYIPPGLEFSPYRASYLCLCVVHLTASISHPSLSKSVKELHDYLKANPINLVTEGYDEPIFENREIHSGIWLTTSIWSKHS